MACRSSSLTSREISPGYRPRALAPRSCSNANAGAGCPALLTLSVAGRVELTPSHPLDAELVAAQLLTPGWEQLLVADPDQQEQLPHPALPVVALLRNFVGICASVHA
mgnify:CR=1 FL=1